MDSEARHDCVIEYFWPENGRPEARLPADANHYSGGRLWGELVHGRT